MSLKEIKVKNLISDMILLIVIGIVCLVGSVLSIILLTEIIALPIILAIFSSAAFIMATIGKVEQTIVITLKSEK